MPQEIISISNIIAMLQPLVNPCKRCKRTPKIHTCMRKFSFLKNMPDQRALYINCCSREVSIHYASISADILVAEWNVTNPKLQGDLLCAA